MEFKARDIRSAIQERADVIQERVRLANESVLLIESGDHDGRTNAENARLDVIAKRMSDLHTREDALGKEIKDFKVLQDLERSQGHQPAAAGQRSVVGRTFAEMFPTAAIDNGGFKSAEEFLATLHSGLHDPRLMAINTGTVPSEGGFAVPSQIFAQWLDAALENEIVRSRCDLRPMNSSDAKAVGWDGADHSSTLFGGFTGQWVAQGDDITVQTPKVRLIDLKARKLAILARTSNELLADGQGFEEQLGAAIPKALGWFLDTAFLQGAGSAGPMGILNASATVTVTKEIGQSPATIMFANLAKMFSRLLPGSHERAVWVINSTAIPYLLQLSIPVGTGGSHVPVLSENGGKWTILTRPVVFTEKAKPIGTKGDVMLCDFSYYVVGLRADFSLAKSVDVGFASDTTYYRGTIRVDGMPKLPAPITPSNGETQSPFVVLETRA